ILGWMIIVLTPITVLVAITLVAEPAAPPTRVSVPWLRSIRELLRNGPFRIFCGAYVLFSLGGSIANATMVFYMMDFLRAPSIVGPSLLASSISTIAAVPLWLRVSRRIGKHRAIALSLFAAIVVFAMVVPFLRPGQGWGFVAILGVLGAITAGYVTLPVGIIGDVIDFDTLKHRLPRGGIYWGTWSFAQKVAPALGIGITLPALKILGFNPGGHNSPAALLALKDTFCFAIIPFLFAGGLLLLRFPIDARRHALIRKRLETRQTRERLESLANAPRSVSR
ncbi:MAG: MFS transporter, partial [Caulobacteraceae bacterium]